MCGMCGVCGWGGGGEKVGQQATVVRPTLAHPGVTEVCFGTKCILSPNVTAPYRRRPLFNFALGAYPSK